MCFVTFDDGADNESFIFFIISVYSPLYFLFLFVHDVFESHIFLNYFTLP